MKVKQMLCSIAPLVLLPAWMAGYPSESTAQKKKGDPTILARYRFDGDAKEATGQGEEFLLKNTEFKDKALYLNGKYGPDGYIASVRTPKLDYTSFTVALRFKSEDFSGAKTNLLIGGGFTRWFGLKRDTGDVLYVTFNNGNFSRYIKEPKLETGKWTTIICGVDLKARKVVVYINGKKAEVIELPKDFKLSVLKSKFKDQDREWTFSNDSNGTVFQGLIDELIIYKRMLSDEEMKRVPLAAPDKP